MRSKTGQKCGKEEGGVSMKEQTEKQQDEGRQEKHRVWLTQKERVVISVILAFSALLVLPVFAWLYMHRSMETITKVNMPNALLIGAGDAKPIQQLELSNIDVSGAQKYKDVVFCVYSTKPGLDYHLQLAHTTNIGFSYEIDKASIEYTDGSTYVGTCDTNGLTGIGKITFINGDFFEGTFLDGYRNGQGVYTWDSGDKYDGEWSSDQMTGTGIYTYSNGSYASGTFDKNMFVSGNYHIENDFGNYTFTITDGKPIAVEASLVGGTSYKGEMSDGKLSGQAQIRYSNGDRYNGNVSNGQRSGQGTYTWTSGASYDGNWSNDQMNGSGTYFYPSSEDGYKLAGSFENGKPNGECKYYADLLTYYQTDWVNGKCVKIYE